MTYLSRCHHVLIVSQAEVQAFMGFWFGSGTYWYIEPVETIKNGFPRVGFGGKPLRARSQQCTGP